MPCVLVAPMHGEFPTSGFILLGDHANLFLSDLWYIFGSIASLLLLYLFKTFCIWVVTFVYYGVKMTFIHVRDTGSLQSSMNMINNFFHGLGFSSIGYESDTLMERCLSDERENMGTSDDLSTLYFYPNFPISMICVFWFLSIPSKESF